MFFFPNFLKNTTLIIYINSIALLTWSTKFSAVNLFVNSVNVSLSCRLSLRARSTFIFFIPLISLDIFNSSIRSVLALRNVSAALGMHWRLTDRAGGGADIVFVAGVLSRTALSSALLMAARGWCFVRDGCGGGGGGGALSTGTGGGGGGQASAALSSRLHGAVIVFKYSDGLIRRSGALCGNAGGTNGSTGCLLTRLGQRGRSSSADAAEPRRPAAKRSPLGGNKRGEKVRASARTHPRVRLTRRPCLEYNQWQN